MESDLDAQHELGSINQHIRQRRQELGLSLRELARRTELTASFLSQVERGQANTSLDSLHRIAEALGVPMMYFLANGSEAMSASRKYSPIVRAHARRTLSLPDARIAYELLTPDLSHKMELVCGRLAPGADNIARPLRESTEECIYVLSGALTVGLADEEYILYPGDAIYFEGAALRTLANTAREDAVWLSVFTPPAF